jgi:drug/metabolite transporter (DMT)-like permease
MFLLIFLYAVLASTFVLAKNALEYAQPCFLIGFRMIIAGMLLLGYCASRGRKHLVVNPGDWGLFIKTALFHIYAAFVLEFWALQYLSALKANIIYSLTPFVAALLSFWIAHERLTIRKWIAILIGFVGVIPVLVVTSEKAELAWGFGHISVPEIVLFGAVVCAVYAWFLIKQLMRKGYHIGFINGMAMVIGGILSLCTSWIFEGFVPPVSDWSLFLWWVFWLIIVANFLFYNLYAFLLRSYSITYITFAGFLSPIFGMLYEWYFMSGVISWHYFVSITVISCGLYLFDYDY